MIRERAIAWAVASADVHEIDTLNILQATLLAMRRAVEALVGAAGGGARRRQPVPDARVPGVRDRQGRSRRRVDLGGVDPRQDGARRAAGASSTCVYPHYGFAQNKGYGTPEHLAALDRHGPCAIHRRSFAPVAQTSFSF